MKSRILLATAAFALLSPLAIAQTNQAANSAMVQQFADLSAQEFVTMAASSDMFEIQSSQLALENAQDAEVKEFAEQMIEDHTKASKQLAQIAASENLTVPDDMAETHEELLATLSSAQGDAFDAAYVTAQAQAHEMALALMTAYGENGDNDKLKAHAETTRPIIAQHLDHAQEHKAGM
jgi:putative membrane protein